MKKPIIDFIQAIEENHFIEAHEILEGSWKILKNQDKPEEARIQKGLINGATAVGLYVQKDRPEAARRLWQSYVEKYRPVILASTDLPHTMLYHEAVGILDGKWQAEMDS